MSADNEAPTVLAAESLSSRKLRVARLKLCCTENPSVWFSTLTSIRTDSNGIQARKDFIKRTYTQLMSVADAGYMENGYMERCGTGIGEGEKEFWDKIRNSKIFGMSYASDELSDEFSEREGFNMSAILPYMSPSINPDIPEIIESPTEYIGESLCKGESYRKHRSEADFFPIHGSVIGLSATQDDEQTPQSNEQTDEIVVESHGSNTKVHNLDPNAFLHNGRFNNSKFVSAHNGRDSRSRMLGSPLPGTPDPSPTSLEDCLAVSHDESMSYRSRSLDVVGGYYLNTQLRLPTTVSAPAENVDWVYITDDDLEDMFHVKHDTDSSRDKSSSILTVDAMAQELREMQGPSNIEPLEVYRLICDLKDPEYTNITLESLSVVRLDAVRVSGRNISVTFTPTVTHCSMASVIGLAIRAKLSWFLGHTFTYDVRIAKGTHSTEEAVNKQMNDKERVTGALENPAVKRMISKALVNSTNTTDLFEYIY